MKGFTETLEAVIGAMIILGVMMFLFSGNVVQETDAYDTSYECLKYAQEFTDFESKLDSCIPASYEYQYKICDNVDCTTILPENQTITSVEYIDSGPRLIKLWVYL